MPGAGDLVTVLSLEDFEFRTGMRNAASDAKNFGKAVADGAEKASAALEKLNRQAVGAIAGAGIGTFLKGIGEGQSERDSAIDSLSAGMSTLAGAFHAVPTWQSQVIAFALDLGAQLVPKLKESSEAAKEFAESMNKMGADLEKNIGRMRGQLGFGRQIKGLEETGTVEDVQRAQEQKTAQIEALTKELQMREKDFRDQMERARGMGGVEGPGGAGIYKIGPEGQRILQGEIPANAQLLPDVLGKPAIEGILERQKRIDDLKNAIADATDEMDRLNKAMQNPEARAEQERRNEIFRKRSKMETDDVNEIERIRQANLTDEERKAELRQRILDLQERNPMLANQLDQALANIDKVKEEAMPTGGAGAVGFGSSEALSNIFAAMRSKGDPQTQAAEKTNELLEEQLTTDDETLTAINDLIAAVDNIGLGAGTF
jgi:hypothetical protein